MFDPSGFVEVGHSPTIDQSGEIGKSCRLSVVTLKRRLPLAMTPCNCESYAPDLCPPAAACHQFPSHARPALRATDCRADLQDPVVQGARPGMPVALDEGVLQIDPLTK